MAYLRKRGNKWYYTIESTNEDGSRRKSERAGTESKTETMKLWRQAQAAVDRGNVVPSTITLAEFLSQWEDEVLNGNRYKPNTIKQYRSVMTMHILPNLGKHKLCKLTPRILQNFLNTLKADLAKSTVNIVCSVLKASMRYAVDYCGYLTTSPAANIHTPRYIEAPKKVEPFTPEEMQQILSHFAGNQIYGAILLAYYAGLRQGECCSLTWQDVDMQSHELTVAHTLVNDNGWVVQAIPKSQSSCRTIPFGQELYTRLNTLRNEQTKNQFQFGTYYQRGHFVCTWPSGEPLNPDDFRYFNQWTKKTFGHGSFHTLRHTYATMLLEHGADLELVSKALGHSSLNTTAQFYSHVLEKRKNQLISIMDEAL